jgi:ferredoxin
MPKVHFLNEVVTIEDAPQGVTIYELARRAGIELFKGFRQTYNCGGKGRCFGAGCRVWVTELEKNAVPLKPRKWWIVGGTVSGAQRMACEATVMGDCEVRTQPGAIRVEHDTQWEPDAQRYRWHDRLVVEKKKKAAKAPVKRAPAAAKAATVARSAAKDDRRSGAAAPAVESAATDSATLATALVDAAARTDNPADSPALPTDSAVPPTDSAAATSAVPVDDAPASDLPSVGAAASPNSALAPSAAPSEPAPEQPEPTGTADSAAAPATSAEAPEGIHPEPSPAPAPTESPIQPPIQTPTKTDDGWDS